MAAPKGNEFWKLRSKHGRDKLFNTPDLLWSAACDYFEWCANNPIGEKMRPFSLTGLMLHLDTGVTFWNDFKRANHKEFSDTITRIEQVIETQQFEGATVGIFNANIIARKLGLADRQEVTGKDGAPLVRSVEIQVIRTREEAEAYQRDCK